MTDGSSNASRSRAIVFPIYSIRLSDDEAASIRISLASAKGMDVVVVCPMSLPLTSIEEMLVRACGRRVCFRVERFHDHFFKDLWSYSRLLLQESFYERFMHYEYILICQLDAILIAPSIDIIGEYDYYGALIESGAPEGGYLDVRNGGFSLRRVSASLAVLQSRKITVDQIRFDSLRAMYGLKNLMLLWILMKIGKRIRLRWAHVFCMFARVNEDVFWSVFAPFFNPAFRVCDLDAARAFSFEKNPSLEYAKLGRLPTGCHAWYKYDRDFWIKKIPALREE